ncbi:MAG: class I SAM-dependent methyltransferase [Segniliparus sp.]|uniref:class I SAM-dependent methyltransferase n=1 Tax=Segniliparus sp. TaxID=2804064 RepID=UPI003F2C3787
MAADEKVQIDFSGPMQTCLLTLYGKALDARSPRPLLGDRFASAAVDRLDYDFGRLKSPKRLQNAASSRSKHFDDHVRRFLAEYPRSTVLHLGAGLDTRVWRVDPGPETMWIDVDLPEVVAAREKLFPAREHYRAFAASATDPAVLEQAPADLPALLVAEGLTMYLDPAEGRGLFRGAAERFPSGSIVFDAQSKLANRMVDRLLRRTFGQSMMRWPIDDPAALAASLPRTRCVEAPSALEVSARIAPMTRSQRIGAAIMLAIPPLKSIGHYVQFDFG